MSNTKELAAQFGATEDEIKSYIDTFTEFDSNKDGRISIDELRRGLAKFGCHVTSDEARKMVVATDANKDLEIDVKEFLAAITRALKKTDLDNEASQAFAVFDKNHDGFISVEELRTTLEKLGQKMTDKEAAQILNAYDKNKDGKMDYNEFVVAWKQMQGQKK